MSALVYMISNRYNIEYTPSLIGGATSGATSDTKESTIRPTSTNTSKFVDELSYDTYFLLTTNVFTKIEWDNRTNFTSMINKFGIDIKELSGVSQEWGQDLVKQIKNTNNKLEIDIVARHQSDRLINEIHNIFPLENISYHLLDNNTNKYNLMKGGNFITLPEYISDASGEKMKSIITLKSNKQLLDITELENKYSPYIYLKVYFPDFEIDTYHGMSVFHIDEILTIIPTGLGKDDYDIWFYNPTCSDESYQEKLVAIQQYNLRILYEFFPESRIKLFELEFVKDGFIKNPPLFNRVILRKGNNFRVIFPKQDEKLENQIKSQIEIYNTNNNIYIENCFVDTSQLHKENGNIHCGYKAIPIIHR